MAAVVALGHVGGGEGPAVLNVLFGNSGDANGWLPAIADRTRAHIPHALHRLKWASPVEKMFEWITDQRVPDADAKNCEENPGPGFFTSFPKKRQGKEKQDRGPELPIGQQVEKLVQNGMVEPPVDPAENSEIQGIDLGDQVSEAKL